MDLEEKNDPMVDACTDFGSYLNKTGTAEAAAGALLKLCVLSTKPENAVEFFRGNLDVQLNELYDKLKMEIQVAHENLDALNEFIADLRAKSIQMLEEEIDSLNASEMMEGDASISETNDGNAEMDATSESTSENIKTEETDSIK